MNFSCGCLFDKKVKEPYFKKSKHFEDLSASFAVNAKNEQLRAHYSWLVQMIKPVGVSRPYIEATFENPVDKEEPIHVRGIQITNEDEHYKYPRYYFISPLLPQLDCKLYDMKITVYTDSSKNKVITEHSNQLLSRINTDTCYKSEFMEKMHAASQYADWTKLDKEN